MIRNSAQASATDASGRIRAWLIAGSFLGLVFSAALVYFILEQQLPSRRIAALRAAAKARGEPWTLQDLASTPVPPEQDAAPLYRQALAAFKRAGAEDVASLLKAHDLVQELNVPLTEEEAAQGRAILEQYRASLQYFDAADARPGYQSWRRLDDGQVVFDFDEPFWFDSDFVNLVTLRSRLALERGDVGAALADARHLLRLDQHLRDSLCSITLGGVPWLPVQTVQLFAMALRRSRLPDGLLRETLQSVEAARAHYASPKRLPILRRALRLHYYQVVLGEAIPRTQAEQAWKRKTPPAGSLAEWLHPLYDQHLLSKLADELGAFDRILAAHDGRPYAAVERDLMAIEDQHSKPTPGGGRSRVIHGFVDSAREDAITKSLLEIIRIALILHAQRPWPEDDAALAQVLGETPIDPLTGQPFRYWRHDHGFELMHPDTKTNSPFFDAPRGYPWRFAYQDDDTQR